MINSNEDFTWWHVPLMPRLRQEDRELQTSLCHIVRLCLEKTKKTNKKKIVRIQQMLVVIVHH
jgi:hypothetical protein